MRNIFLSIPKDLYNLKLKPLELLILSQILEWDRNNRECYETDAALAERFNVSVPTVNNTIKTLADKELIFKNTVYTKGGRQRTLLPNTNQIESLLSKLSETTAAEDLTRDTTNKEILRDSNKNFKSAHKNFISGSEEIYLTKDKREEKISNKNNLKDNTPPSTLNFIRDNKSKEDKVRDLLSRSIVVSPSDAEWVELTKEEWRNIGFAALAHCAGTIEDIHVYQANGKIYLVRFPA